MDTFPFRNQFMPSFEKMFVALKDIDVDAVAIKTAGNALGLVQRVFPDEYEKIDSLADHFVESERIRCNERGKPSPLEAWTSLLEEGIKIKKSSSKEVRKLREMVYKKARGCNLFNPVLAMHIFSSLGKRGKILDCAAGWGDRLLAACALDVEEYRAWDPNPDLLNKYSDIAKACQSFSSPKTMWSVECKPFEKSTPPKRYFDLSFGSPPFFDKELYRGDETSTTLYRSRDEWIAKFYIPMLRIMISSTKKGGKLALYLPPKGFMIDIARKELRFFKPLGSAGFRQISPEGTPLGDIRMVYAWQL